MPDAVMISLPIMFYVVKIVLFIYITLNSKLTLIMESGYCSLFDAILYRVRQIYGNIISF